VSLIVNEIFYSIQGESSFAGLPCVFIRLTGCNLRCYYCDTRYAYEGGDEIQVLDIIERISIYRCSLIEITGGEPLIQIETPNLVKLLLDKGYTVLIETNGSQDISRIDDRSVRIIDIKCPLSGEMERNDLGNLNRLTHRDEIKFVLSGREDYEYAKKMMNQIGLSGLQMGGVHFSPVPGKISPQVLARWILQDHLNVRLHLQFHKIIWGADRRGV
jgi:7-carboxy-7-deazaguanine synthase